ncbi:unnamed protein product [Protopolystoma xenopodis]|uniref:Glutaredoxin domain-containing protein n=1 Tax=Protopolystoma xenopodis TaxID=117903 RepID=A0A3S5BMP9_9PLAT|nr:unnamed protein product [Protopolystoma xenopodis]
MPFSAASHPVTLSSNVLCASSLSTLRASSRNFVASLSHLIDSEEAKNSSTSTSSYPASSPEVAHIGELTRAARIVLFMKGDPFAPRCGFSNAVCRILEMHGLLERMRSGEVGLFASHDVLVDENLRKSAKVYADWPTFPQVYFDGDFIGGCDILLEMHQSGKLAEELETRGIGSALKESKN